MEGKDGIREIVVWVNGRDGWNRGNRSNVEGIERLVRMRVISVMGGMEE